MKPALVFIGSVLAVLTLVLFLTGCSTVPDKQMIPAKPATTSADINQALAAIAARSIAPSLDYQIAAVGRVGRYEVDGFGPRTKAP
jgi:hypothetical protein